MIHVFSTAGKCSVGLGNSYFENLPRKHHQWDNEGLGDFLHRRVGESRPTQAVQVLWAAHGKTYQRGLLIFWGFQVNWYKSRLYWYVYIYNFKIFFLYLFWSCFRFGGLQVKKEWIVFVLCFSVDSLQYRMLWCNRNGEFQNFYIVCWSSSRLI